MGRARGVWGDRRAVQGGHRMSARAGPVFGGPSATPRRDDVALNDYSECVVPVRLTAALRAGVCIGALRGTRGVTVSATIRLRRRVCCRGVLEFGVDAAAFGELVFENDEVARGLDEVIVRELP